MKNNDLDKISRDLFCFLDNVNLFYLKLTFKYNLAKAVNTCYNK